MSWMNALLGEDGEGIPLADLEAFGEFKPAPEPAPSPEPKTRTPAERAEHMFKFAQEEGFRGEELALFMGQVEHESGGFKGVVESFNYSIDGLKLFSKYLNAEARARLGRQPGEKTVPIKRQQEIANLVYGGRMGNNRQNDGWNYRGHGLIQLTGLNNFVHFAKVTGIPIDSNPDLAFSEKHIYDLAVVFWTVNVRPAIASKGLTLEVVTKVINGGTNGIADRRVQSEKWRKRVLKDGLL